MSKPTCSPAASGLNPAAVQQTVRVLSQRRMARDTYCLRLETPEIASRIVPGQFFMVRPVEGVNPLLGRPFALFDTFGQEGEPEGVEFGYVVVGKLTSLMPEWKPGDKVSIWGPLGNGFPLPEADHLMLVAGGIGQTPFLAVAREALGLRTYGSPPRVVRGARAESLSVTACGRPTIWPAWRIFLSPDSKCAWRPTTAPAGTAALSPICWMRHSKATIGLTAFTVAVRSR